jgi:hypothetical protein
VTKLGLLLKSCFLFLSADVSKKRNVDSFSTNLCLGQRVSASLQRLLGASAHLQGLPGSRSLSAEHGDNLSQTCEQGWQKAEPICAFPPASCLWSCC